MDILQYEFSQAIIIKSKDKLKKNLLNVYSLCMAKSLVGNDCLLDYSKVYHTSCTGWFQI